MPNRVPKMIDSETHRGLRVLYVTMRFPLGSETFAAVEVRALRRTGVDISVECLRGRRADCQKLLSEFQLSQLPLGFNSLMSSLRGLRYGVTRPRLLCSLVASVFRCSKKWPNDVLIGLLFAPRVLDLFAQIESDPPDVVHIYWGHYPSLLGLLVEHHLPSILVSLSLGNYDMDRKYGGSKALANRVPMVWTLSEANCPTIEALGVAKSNIEVCYHGIHVPDLDDKVAAKITGRILVIERLIPTKFTSDAIKAFSLIHEAIPGSSLYILGDGAERAHLVEMVNNLGLGDSVRFLGFVSHDQVYDSLSTADVLISMSRHPSERLPNVVKEAMSQHCVPVVTWSPGIEELVTDGVDGFVVAQGDVDAAAEKTCRLLDSQDLRAQFAKRARAKIEESFDTDRLAARRLEIWRTLIEQRSQATTTAIED